MFQITSNKFEYCVTVMYLMNTSFQRESLQAIMSSKFNGTIQQPACQSAG